MDSKNVKLNIEFDCSAKDLIKNNIAINKISNIIAEQVKTVLTDESMFVDLSLKEMLERDFRYVELFDKINIEIKITFK